MEMEASPITASHHQIVGSIEEDIMEMEARPFTAPPHQRVGSSIEEDTMVLGVMWVGQ